MHVSDCCYFTDLNISQGCVATHLRYDEIFNDSLIANFLLILLVKEFENRSTFGKVTDKGLVSWFF